MRARVARIALVLPLLLSACAHKNRPQAQAPLAPPIEDTPLPPPSKAPANLPPAVVSKPQPPITTPSPAPKPQPTIAPPKHTRRSQASKPAQAAVAPPTPAPQQAAAAPGVSALGDLSSGDPSDLRQQTSTSINDVERRLNGINRKLNDQEQKTSAQIREFLKQARTALGSGDVDGAHTLAIKARVLLDELNQ